MRPFQFHLKKHWRYPQSLDSLLPWSQTISAHLGWWQNPTNVMKGADLNPQDHSIQIFTDASNEGWATHLEQALQKVCGHTEKRLHINVPELKAVSLALRKFKDQCQNQTVLVATDNSTGVAYINLSDLFMYLYQDLNRPPSTIDGYRTAIVDTLGPVGLHISQSSDLNRLLSSFHRDHPKTTRSLPKCNLSVVLNELTKQTEPMKDTDLKHLTLKTAFLLALASGKRRSEIHA